MLQKYLLAFVCGGIVAASVVYFVVGRRPVPQPAPAPMESTQPPPAPATVPATAAETPAAPQPPDVTPAPFRAAHKTKSEPSPQQPAEPVSSAPPPAEPVEVAQAQPQPEVPPPPTPAPAPDIVPQAPPAPQAEAAPQPSQIMRPDAVVENRDRTPQTVTIPAGTLVAVRLREPIGTDKQSEGDPFTATLDQPIVIDGFVIAERGALARGKIASLTRATRGQSHAAITLALTELNTTDGQKVDIRTDESRKAATANTKDGVTKIGVGTVLGAIIGAAAGGGKGAAIGAGAGAGVGGGAVLAGKGDEVRLPSETRLSFKLAEAVTLTEKLK